ncbi:fatty acid desaturase [Pedobacter sp. MR2016-19]|uniref:fatty acid desaturase family protein n=1 Tax=Pedobacter sp. MR2016-19 TaxID=2780089 RepID=UPI001875D9C9|nr:fatty acid desaturase [Pedobacter sp. MR2016-19]MBE5322045.1 fatty acid desaturase [Pedobacter sp. MR2016-19]
MQNKNSMESGAEAARMTSILQGAVATHLESTSKTISVGAEVNEIKKALQAQSAFQELKDLMKPKTKISMGWILRSILSIAFATWLTYQFTYLLPLGMLLLTRSLRALGNQVHDLSHFNIFKSAKVNKWLGTWILGPLMFYDFETFLNNHKPHHSELGVDGKDEDIIICSKTIKPTDSDLVAFLKIYLPLLTDKKLWLSSVFGHLAKPTWKGRARILGFWALTMACIAAIFSFKIMIFFGFTWILARATTYHALKMLVELADHACLDATSVINYTRTMPDNWLSYLIHPENDNWHTAHHLFPKVPMPNLKKAHTILLKVPQFKAAIQLDSYFTGRNSLIKSLRKHR